MYLGTFAPGNSFNSRNWYNSWQRSDKMRRWRYAHEEAMKGTFKQKSAQELLKLSQEGQIKKDVAKINTTPANREVTAKLPYFKNLAGRVLATTDKEKALGQRALAMIPYYNAEASKASAEADYRKSLNAYTDDVMKKYLEQPPTTPVQSGVGATAKPPQAEETDRMTKKRKNPLEDWNKYYDVS